jgi:hypothetical protein
MTKTKADNSKDCNLNIIMSMTKNRNKRYIKFAQFKSLCSKCIIIKNKKFIRNENNFDDFQQMQKLSQG